MHSQPSSVIPLQSSSRALPQTSIARGNVCARHVVFHNPALLHVWIPSTQTPIRWVAAGPV